MSRTWNSAVQAQQSTQRVQVPIVLSIFLPMKSVSAHEYPWKLNDTYRSIGTLLELIHVLQDGINKGVDDILHFLLISRISLVEDVIGFNCSSR